MLYYIMVYYVVSYSFMLHYIIILFFNHDQCPATCLIGCGGDMPPQYSQNCKKVGKMVDYAARELVTVLPVTFLSVTVVGPSGRIGQNAPPSQWKGSRHISVGIDRCSFILITFHSQSFFKFPYLHMRVKFSLHSCCLLP